MTRYVVENMLTNQVTELELEEGYGTSVVISHNITGLLPNRNYPIRVRARNDKGDGPWSNITHLKTSKLKG